MSDTRVDQIAALLADAATIARELDDEVERGHKAHHDLQWLLVRLAQAQSHTTHLKEAFMERCTASPLTGGRCDLEVGHEGKHRKTSYPEGPNGRPFTFEWDDESQTALIKRYQSRLD